MTSETGKGPAYRIHTPRLVVRCMNPEDALMFRDAVDENLEHLRPWMSWTRHEPRDLEEKLERLRQLRSNFDQDRDFVYGIFNQEETRILGAAGLHTRQGPDSREVSYWIHHEFVGQGMATEVAAALVRVAFEVDQVRRVEIHCDPNNLPSAAIPKKLGFKLEATLRERQFTGEGELRDTMIWGLFEDGYRQSPARDALLEAFDGIGRRML